MACLVLFSLVQMGLIGAIIFVSMTLFAPGARSVGVSASVGQSVQVEGLGMLDLWGFDWDSVVDLGDVDGSVPGSAFVVNWDVVSIMMFIVMLIMVTVAGDLGVSGSVEGLGVLNFWGFYWDALDDLRNVDWSVPLLNGGFMVIPVVTGSTNAGGSVGGEVSSLSSGHFRSIVGNVRSGADRSHQQH